MLPYTTAPQKPFQDGSTTNPPQHRLLVLSRLVVSDSLRPFGGSPPGFSVLGIFQADTGVGCQFLLHTVVSPNYSQHSSPSYSQHSTLRILPNTEALRTLLNKEAAQNPQHGSLSKSSEHSSLLSFSTQQPLRILQRMAASKILLNILSPPESF